MATNEEKLIKAIKDTEKQYIAIIEIKNSRIEALEFQVEGLKKIALSNRRNPRAEKLVDKIMMESRGLGVKK